MNRWLFATTVLTATLSITAGCAQPPDGATTSAESLAESHPDWCLTEAAFWTNHLDANGNSNAWTSSNGVDSNGHAGPPMGTYGSATCPYFVMDYAMPTPPPPSQFAIRVQSEIASDATMCTSGTLTLTIAGQAANGTWTTLLGTTSVNGAMIPNVGCNFDQPQPYYYVEGNAPYTRLRLIARLIDLDTAAGVGGPRWPIGSDAVADPPAQIGAVPFLPNSDGTLAAHAEMPR